VKLERVTHFPGMRGVKVLGGRERIIKRGRGGVKILELHGKSALLALGGIQAGSLSLGKLVTTVIRSSSGFPWSEKIGRARECD